MNSSVGICQSDICRISAQKGLSLLCMNNVAVILCVTIQFFFGFTSSFLGLLVTNVIETNTHFHNNLNQYLTITLSFFFTIFEYFRIRTVSLPGDTKIWHVNKHTCRVVCRLSSVACFIFLKKRTQGVNGVKQQQLFSFKDNSIFEQATRKQNGRQKYMDIQGTLKGIQNIHPSITQ